MQINELPRINRACKRSPESEREASEGSCGWSRFRLIICAFAYRRFPLFSAQKQHSSAAIHFSTEFTFLLPRPETNTLKCSGFLLSADVKMFCVNAFRLQRKSWLETAKTNSSRCLASLAISHTLAQPYTFAGALTGWVESSARATGGSLIHVSVVAIRLHSE